MRSEPTEQTTARPLRAALLSLLLGLLLAAALAGSASAANFNRVAVLGDSSASGPELGFQLPGSPPECARTSGGWPTLAGIMIGAAELVNETCSGAVASSITNGYQFPAGGSWVRPQLDALDGNEDAVLLAIGDNDAGFGEVTSTCLYHGGDSTDACTNSYVHGGVNTLVGRAQAISGGVAGAIDAIRQRSPRARIFLVGYLDIAPEDPATCSGLLWLTAADAPVFNQWEVAVNETLRAVAAGRGVGFIDAHALSGEHTACAPSPPERWINPFVGALGGVAIHPSPSGAAAVAVMAAQALSAVGPPESPETLPDEPKLELLPLGFKHLRPAARGGSFSRNRPARGGGALTLTLTRVADVSLRLERVRAGRMHKGHCRAKTRQNRNGRPCSRRAAQGGWWSARLPSGNSRIWVTGRLRGRALSSGQYRVRLRSADLPASTGSTPTFSVRAR